MIKSFVDLFGSFVFSVMEFLLFLGICAFILFVGIIFWDFLKYPIIFSAAWILFYSLYKIIEIIIEKKRIEHRESIKENEENWVKQELQRPIIQRILQKQEENKPFITGTITHVSNDGKETKLGNITINLKGN